MKAKIELGEINGPMSGKGSVILDLEIDTSSERANGPLKKMIQTLSDAKVIGRTVDVLIDGFSISIPVREINVK